MPISVAISGIVIPGLALTSSTVWSARVPDPRGRPRLPALAAPVDLLYQNSMLGSTIQDPETVWRGLEDGARR
jgi:hypothetical protein